MTPELPTITDVLLARRTLQPHLPETPSWSYPALDAETGAAIYLKHEGMQPTGAFKVRGGLNLLAMLAPEERERGLITASTGNHAQSIAYAGRQFGAQVTIVMPDRANPAKARAVRALGARLVLHGDTFDDARRQAAELAAAEGLRLVDPGDEPLLIAGVGTAALEFFGAVPDLDMLLVPVGSGTGAAAAALVAAAVSPGCAVIGVQSTGSPAAHDSWHAGTPVSRPDTTRAEGLATGTGFALPQALMRRYLADFVVVSDDALESAQAVLLNHAHTLTEMAGAAPLAAVLTNRSRFAGRRIGVMCTGANASMAELSRVTEAACLVGIGAE
jgi:threonine dehydratase